MIGDDAETSPEKFGLFWPGKARSQAVAQLPTTATLKPAPEESVDWDTTNNIFIEGDNLEVLKTLQDSYRRKINMIYIDPPYNTGKEFIYPDNFQEGLQSYLEYTGQKNESGEVTESKKETSGRKHSNWLSMMYPRLQLAKSLLANDGVIFISIDDHEQDNLKRICTEIFGEDKFIGSIAWKKTSGDNKPSFAFTHDQILIFGKNSSELPRIKLSPSQLKQYNNPDNDTKGDWAESDYRSKWNKNERPSLYYPITNPNTGEEIYPDTYANTSRVWGCSMETHFENIKNELVWWGKDGKSHEPRKKRYLKDHKGVNIRSVWAEAGTNDDASRELVKLFPDTPNIFDTPKPTKLIEYILNIFDKNAIVMDFFSGSGTTGHAVMQKNAEDNGNRKYIQVQLPENTYTIDDNGNEVPSKQSKEAYDAGYRTIADIAKERLRRSGTKIKLDFKDKLVELTTPLDTGFRVYKLTESNFTEWDEKSAANNIEQAVLDFANNKKVALHEDLLSEIMLRSRIMLDADIKKHNLLSGGWVYIINDGQLIAYVDDAQLTVEQATEIADMAPGKFVALDSAFNGNDALKINIANICKDKFIREFKTI